MLYYLLIIIIIIIIIIHYGLTISGLFCVSQIGQFKLLGDQK